MQDGGMEIAALQNRPVLNQWVSEYWEAYHFLGSSRAIHQGGVGPIPLTEIVAYMDAIYLRDVDERLRMITMIQSLDRVYVKHVNDKANKRMADHKARAGRRTPRRRQR